MCGVGQMSRLFVWVVRTRVHNLSRASGGMWAWERDKAWEARARNRGAEDGGTECTYVRGWTAPSAGVIWSLGSVGRAAVGW